MLERLRLTLSTVQAASEIEGMNLPTFHRHPLKGKWQGFYAVTVRANWGLVFRLKDGVACHVDFLDYH
jgi:toxin HigB-1